MERYTDEDTRQMPAEEFAGDEQEQIIVVQERSNRFKWTKRAAVVAAGAAAAAYYLSGGCQDSGRSNKATVEAQEVAYAMPEWEVEIGEVVVNSAIRLEYTWGDQRCAPVVGCVGIHKTDTYSAQGHATNEYSVDNAEVWVETSREDVNNDGVPDGAPEADDKVRVVIDPTTLTINSRLEVMQRDDKILTVRDGMVIEEDGEELEEPRPIFREDGDVALWGFDNDGGDSNFTAFVERFGMNFFDIGEDQPGEATTAVAIAASDPECDAAVREIFEDGLETLAETSAVLEFTGQGYSKGNIEVVSSTGRWNWVEPEDVKDDSGQTFDSRVEEYEDHLSESIDEGAGQAVSFDNSLECTTDGVVDTSNLITTRDN